MEREAHSVGYRALFTELLGHVNRTRDTSFVGYTALPTELLSHVA